MASEELSRKGVRIKTDARCINDSFHWRLFCSVCSYSWNQRVSGITVELTARNRTETQQLNTNWDLDEGRRHRFVPFFFVWASAACVPRVQRQLSVINKRLFYPAHSLEPLCLSLCHAEKKNSNKKEKKKIKANTSPTRQIIQLGGAVRRRREETGSRRTFLLKASVCLSHRSDGTGHHWRLPAAGVWGGGGRGGKTHTSPCLISDSRTKQDLHWLTERA